MTIISCPICGGSGGGFYPMQCNYCNGSGDFDGRDRRGRHLTYEAANVQASRVYRRHNRYWGWRSVIENFKHFFRWAAL